MSPLRLAVSLFALLIAAPASAQNNEQIVSKCIAIAQALPGATYAKFTPEQRPPFQPVASTQDEVVKITYAGHSTFVIESPGGVRIATDFSGVYGGDSNPRVVTMNKAHRTHYTDNPPATIEYVLRGWGDGSEPARHRLQVDDVTIRNVTTDIRRWGWGENSEGLERDGNSIFIFETGNLCIGHLGHLHTRLSDQQFGQIGRLDVLMVPIDGGMTQSVGSMSEIATRLYSSVILPMHRHSTPIGEFTGLMGDQFAVEFRTSRSLELSLRTLPRQPTIIVLEGV